MSKKLFDIDKVYANDLAAIKKQPYLDKDFQEYIDRVAVLGANRANLPIEDGKHSDNLGISTIVKVSHSGSVKPFLIRAKQVGILPVRDKYYTYSTRALSRLRAAERAVRAQAIVKGVASYLLTLTFPKDFENDDRWRINDRFRKNIRMRFDAGLWCAEAHTGKDYVTREGVHRIGDKEMRGKIHFHYRVNTSESFSSVKTWLLAQQEIDKVENFSYDIKFSKMKWLYLSLHESKAEQKELVIHTGRLWATWGVDKSPEFFNVLEMEEFGVYSAIDNKEVYTDSSIHVAIQKKKLLKIKHNGTEF